MDKFIRFAKQDARRQVVLGLVYEPMTLDTQGDYATAEVIERAAYSFTANGKSAAVDINHDGKPCGARIVESYLAKQGDSDFAPGSWVLGVWTPNEVWADVTAGRLTGFSMTGNGQRVAKSLNGVSAHEIQNLSVSGVSLVNRPANKTSFAVLKADAPPWAQALIDSTEALAAAVAKFEGDLKATKKVAKSRGWRTVERTPDPAEEIRKAVETEHLAKQALEIRGLERRQAVLHERLHRLWEGDGARLGNAAERERHLLAEIEKGEIELASLRSRGDVFDVDNPARSAFHQRGGSSVRASAAKIFPGGDSAYAPKKDAAIRKAAEDAIDLGSLKI